VTGATAADTRAATAATEMCATTTATCGTAAATAVEATAATAAVGSTAAATAVGATAAAAAFSRIGRGRKRGRKNNHGNPKLECRHDVPRSARGPNIWVAQISTLFMMAADKTKAH